MTLYYDMPKINRVVGGINRVGKSKVWNLQNFYDRYNRILIRRCSGGLGDIMMHRMIFEDFKLICPEIIITFACPKFFHQAVQDHPFIDEVLDVDVDMNNFIAKYDTSTICGFVESFTPNCQIHRSDIWADTCGLNLTRHNMHIKLTDAEINEAKDQISNINKEGKPIVAIAPISALSNKNMTEEQHNGVLKELQKMGYFAYGLHSCAISNFEGPQLHGKNIRNFMGLINAADYLICVDTSTFHIAGGLGKPQVGVFAWKDGLVYGKYYTNWELVQKNMDNKMSDITVKEIIDGFKRLISK